MVAWNVQQTGSTAAYKLAPPARSLTAGQYRRRLSRKMAACAGHQFRHSMLALSPRSWAKANTPRAFRLRPLVARNFACLNRLVVALPVVVVAVAVRPRDRSGPDRSTARPFGEAEPGDGPREADTGLRPVAYAAWEHCLQAGPLRIREACCVIASAKRF